ncbi:helix-turn-helix domain-containing protein [Sporomusa aerivorans]|uniref:helix-turn-helix domain-containing protein n=1 Tax=Sporomusa aerivorans TaxID=204936 RepID=UPI00352B735F
MMNTAERIIQLRSMKNYTTNKLAQLAGIGQATLRDIEIGKKNPNITTLEKICQALDISLAEFFTEPQPNPVIREENEKYELPDEVKKEIALIEEFVLYKHGIKKAGGKN